MLYVDDKLPRHPKIFRAGRIIGDHGAAQALALYLDGLSYAREHLTDGFLPDAYVRRSPLVSAPELVANALASRAVRLWHKTKGGYRIHDYHHWNQKAKDIKEKREKKRIQKAAERAGKRPVENSVSPGVSPGDNVATSRARASTDPRTTYHGTTESTGRVVPLIRAAAEPPSPLKALRNNPLSADPAPDGNYAVIERIAHEAMDILQTSEPTPEVVERVKQLCAQRRIDYGRHPDVAKDVVRKAVVSAAAQRVLRGGAPTSLGDMARSFQARMAKTRT
jgi:hypothetical protein